MTVSSSALRTLVARTWIFSLVLALISCENPPTSTSLTTATVGGTSGVTSSEFVVTWERMPSGIDAGIRGIWGTSATNLYAVGFVSSTEGILIHSTNGGKTWTREITAPQPLQAVWGTGASDVYAVGDGERGLHHFDGSDWTDFATGPSHQDMRGIWGLSETEVYIAGSEDSFGAHGFQRWDGMSLTVIDVSNAFRATDLFGSSSSDMWATSNRQLWHWDGTTMTSVPGADTDGGKTLNAIWGSGTSDDYFAVGSQSLSSGPVGIIEHYDGTGWTLQEDRLSGVPRDVWGTSPTNVFVGGGFGLLLHYDGTAWSPVSSAGGPTAGVAALWVAPTGEIYAVTREGSEAIFYRGVPGSTPDENEPPSATILSPGDGATFPEGEEITFEGSGTDPEDGTLAGTSLEWASDLDGAIGTGSSFSAVLSVGTHTVTLAATDSDGATSTASVSVTVEPVNEPPSATILSPSDGAEFVDGEAIAFEGSGTDPEDGTLSGSSLVWTSDLDGQIGTGSSFVRSDFSVGTHALTLTAIDSEGAEGTATVSITVEELTPASLADVVAGMLADGEITDPDVADGLIDKLEAAQTALDRGNDVAAERILRAFIRQVEAQRGKAITEQAADELVELANRLIGEI